MEFLMEGYFCGKYSVCSLLQWLPAATNANLFLLYLPREPTTRENSKGKQLLVKIITMMISGPRNRHYDSADILGPEIFNMR